MEKITFQDIDSYQRIKKCNLSQYEIKLIQRMNVWAHEQIQELEDKE